MISNILLSGKSGIKKNKDPRGVPLNETPNYLYNQLYTLNEFPESKNKCVIAGITVIIPQKPAYNKSGLVCLWQCQFQCI